MRHGIVVLSLIIAIHSLFVRISDVFLLQIKLCNVVIHRIVCFNGLFASSMPCPIPLNAWQKKSSLLFWPIILSNQNSQLTSLKQLALR